MYGGFRMANILCVFHPDIISWNHWKHTRCPSWYFGAIFIAVSYKRLYSNRSFRSNFMACRTPWFSGRVDYFHTIFGIATCKYSIYSSAHHTQGNSRKNTKSEQIPLFYILIDHHFSMVVCRKSNRKSKKWKRLFWFVAHCLWITLVGFKGVDLHGEKILSSQLKFCVEAKLGQPFQTKQPNCGTCRSHWTGYVSGIYYGFDTKQPLGSG